MSQPVAKVGDELRHIISLTTDVKITAIYRVTHVLQMSVMAEVNRFDIPAGVCKLCWCEAMTCDCDGGPKL